jgi:hypothetical protein
MELSIDHWILREYKREERGGFVTDCTEWRISAAMQSFPFLNSDTSSRPDEQIVLDRPIDQILKALHREL